MDVNGHVPGNLVRRPSVDLVRAEVRRSEYYTLISHIKQSDFDKICKFLNGSETLNRVLSDLENQEYSADSYADEINYVLDQACEKLDAFLKSFEQQMDEFDQACNDEHSIAFSYPLGSFSESEIKSLRSLENHAEKILSKRVQASCKNIVKLVFEHKKLPEKNSSSNDIMTTNDQLEQKLISFGERATALLERSSNDSYSRLELELKFWMSQLNRK